MSLIYKHTKQVLYYTLVNACLTLVVFLSLFGTELQAQKKGIPEDTVITRTKMFGAQIVAPSIREYDSRSRLIYEFGKEKTRKHLKTLELELDDKTDTINVTRSIVLEHMKNEIISGIKKLNLDRITPKEALIKLSREILAEFAEGTPIDTSVLRKFIVEVKNKEKYIRANLDLLYNLLTKDTVLNKQIILDRLGNDLVRLGKELFVTKVDKDTNITKIINVDVNDDAGGEVTVNMLYTVNSRDTVLEKKVIADVLNDPRLVSIDRFLIIKSVDSDSSVSKEVMISVKAEKQTQVVNSMKYFILTPDTTDHKTVTMDVSEAPYTRVVSRDLLLTHLDNDTNVRKNLSLDVLNFTVEKAIFDALDYKIFTKDTVIERQVSIEVTEAPYERSVEREILLTKVETDTNVRKFVGIDVFTFDKDIVTVSGGLKYQVNTKDTTLDKTINLDVALAPYTRNVISRLLIKSIDNDTVANKLVDLDILDKTEKQVLNSLAFLISDETPDTTLNKELAFDVLSRAFNKVDQKILLKKIDNDSIVRKKIRLSIEKLKLIRNLLVINDMRYKITQKDSNLIRELKFDILNNDNGLIEVGNKIIQSKFKKEDYKLYDYLRSQITSDKNINASLDVKFKLPKNDTVVSSVIIMDVLNKERDITLNNSINFSLSPGTSWSIKEKRTMEAVSEKTLHSYKVVAKASEFVSTPPKKKLVEFEIEEQ